MGDRFKIEDYIEEKVTSRMLAMYRAVLFYTFCYMAPFGVFMITTFVAYGYGLSSIAVISLSIATTVSVVAFLLAYISHVSKRYLGLTCFSTLYALRNGVTTFIEWIPIRVRSIPIDVGDGRTMYLNEVVCHSDSDIPYLLLVTPGKFDTNGGEMCVTRPDYKFYRFVKCPVALGYNVCIDLRSFDIGVVPGEDIGEVEERIPVPLMYMIGSDYTYNQFWKKSGLVYFGEDVVKKSIDVFGDLYATYYRERCAMLEKRLEELEKVRLDAKKLAIAMYKKAVEDHKVFGEPEITVKPPTAWEKMSKTKKIITVLLVALAIFFGVMMIWTFV